MNKQTLHYLTRLGTMIFILIVFQIVACQPQQIWKKPTPMAIQLKIQHQNSNGPGYLEFTGGQIILSKIAVEGNLVAADDFRFERDFPLGLVVDFNDTTTLDELIFDLPQGDYTTLRIHLETISSNQNIAVEGIYDYNNPNKSDAIVNFEVDSLVVFDIDVTNSSGGSNINIDASTTNSIEILLNPPYWFKNTTATIMNNAATTIINSQSYITINRLTNSNIYQDAKARIGGDILSTLN